MPKMVLVSADIRNESRILPIKSKGNKYGMSGNASLLYSHANFIDGLFLL